jgi:hypothetical protein
MSLLAHFEPLEGLERDQRGAPRLLLSLEASLEPCFSDVTIHNLSTTGLLLETSAELQIGDTIEVQMPEIGPTPATVLWRDGCSCGCQFGRPLPRAAVSAALLRSQPATQVPGATTGVDRDGRSLASEPRRLWPTIASSAGLVAIAAVGLAAAVAAPGVAAAVFLALVALLVLWGFAILDGTFELNL